MKVRTRIKQDFEKAFEKVDRIMTPNLPHSGFQARREGRRPLAMYLSDVYTTSPALAGIPAISIPCGESSFGLPIGLQIIGRAFDEQTLLNFAYILERKLATRRKL